MGSIKNVVAGKALILQVTLIAGLILLVEVVYSSSLGFSMVSQTSNTSRLAAIGASSAALLAYGRVRAYPGAFGFAYIAPTFATTYGLAVAILLVFRLPYSSVLLLSDLILSIAVAWATMIYLNRNTNRQFHLIPLGKAEKIAHELSNVHWVILQQPTMPVASAGIVADLHHDLEPAWEQLLADATLSGLPVYHYKQFRESITGRVEIEHLSENSFGSLLPNLTYSTLKRLLDLTLSLLLLTIFSPVILVVAALIRIDSRGPALFRQERMGYRGKVFTMVKLRTMHHQDPRTTAADALNEAKTRAADGRITRVGRFLRKTRLDELPQLINVAKGEMSLIGPRPEAMALSSWYESELPFYIYRHIVRPGITGWAQVSQGHVTELNDVHSKLHYDFYYIKNFSAWIDTLIAIKTIGVIFSGSGAK